MLTRRDDSQPSDSFLCNCVGSCRLRSGHTPRLKETRTSQPASFIVSLALRHSRLGAEKMLSNVTPPRACYFPKEFRTQKPFYLPFPEVWNGGAD